MAERVRRVLVTLPAQAIDRAQQVTGKSVNETLLLALEALGDKPKGVALREGEKPSLSLVRR